MDDRALRWWTKPERKRFNATANSPDVLGVHARHGTSRGRGYTGERMTDRDASWLVRRIVAHWLTHLEQTGT